MTVGGAGARRKEIQSEDMNVIEDLFEFNAEVIKTLCNSVHKPGGTIADPTNANLKILNPGINIPVICEKCFKSVTKMYGMVGIGLTDDSMSIICLRLLEAH